MGLWVCGPSPGPPWGDRRQAAGGRRQTCASVGRPSIAALCRSGGGPAGGWRGRSLCFEPRGRRHPLPRQPPRLLLLCPSLHSRGFKRKFSFLGPSLNKSLVPLRSPALQGAPSPRLAQAPGRHQQPSAGQVGRAPRCQPCGGFWVVSRGHSRLGAVWNQLPVGLSLWALALLRLLS